MKISSQEKNEIHEISIEGSFDVSKIAEARDLIYGLLKNVKKTTWALQEVQKCDVSSLQLLIVSASYMEANNITYQLSTCSDSIYQTCDELGLNKAC